MNKLFITTAIALSALSLVSAQDATVTTGVAATATVTAPAMPPALPPLMSTGDKKIDEQVRALHKEMEGKIKVIRDEYQKKLKKIIGERKLMMASTTKEMASTTKEMRKDVMEVRKDARAEVRKEVKTIRQDAKAEVQGARAESGWGLLKRFFGAPAVEGQADVQVTQ